MKIAFVFPGQGSQKVGMIKELAESKPEVMAIFDAANKILGRDLKKIIFEGPEEDLKDTRNTQPALFTASMAALEAFKGHGINPIVVAGHSLGEYSALAAGGALSFEQALPLVQARANAMAEAGAASGGAMAAVLGMEDDAVSALCAEVSGKDKVQAANFNCPGQVVISGAPAAVELFISKAKEAGAKRAMLLPVSGAFHSVYMEPAGQVMKPLLDAAQWNKPLVPVVVNVKGTAVDDASQYAAYLVEQMSGSVQWTKSVQTMKAMGVTHYVEIGSGKVLSGLIKKIDSAGVTLNVEDMASLESTIVALKDHQYE